MRIIGINLDRAPERWASIQDQAQKLGLRIDRLPAVDGNKLSDPPFPGVPLGAIGCFLSHRNAWEEVAASDEAYTLIIEDDARLSADLPKFLSNTDWIPSDAEIVHLGGVDRSCYVYRKCLPAFDRNLYRLGSYTGTDAYIISKCCAKKLLQDFTSIEKEFDQVLFNGGRPDLIIYKILPTLVTQNRDVFAGLIDRDNAPAYPNRSARFRARIHRFKRSIRRKLSGYQKLKVEFK